MSEKKLLRLAPDDLNALATIKARYGCESDSQAMRLALRVLAASPPLTVTLPARPKKETRP